MNMVLTEWNLEEAKEVWREEGLEEGWEKGRKEAEAKYQPVIVEKNRERAELRRKLRDPPAARGE
jgi:flagellar biosynthesis/type III secretory pathway protein FliH